jgi:glyoxylase-like metal-dependent hydrolase (beta-lactamase superfamily II)
MRKTLALTVAIVLFSAVASHAQDGRATLENVAKAMGATTLNTVQYTGSGMIFSPGQSPAPGKPWPRFNLKSLTRSVNYETASLRDEIVRTQAEDPPRGGGGQPVRGEARQVFVLSGDHAWTVAADQSATTAPRYIADFQSHLWLTPHGVIKAAMASNAAVQGRTITFTRPGRFTAKVTVNDRNLIDKIEATVANAVVGDMPLEVTYSDYQDFGGVKFPMKIKHTAGGYPALDMTVTDVKLNAAVDIQAPDSVRQAMNPYAKVTSQQVADGVWYLTGMTHHSVAIEMKDYVIVVESPINDDRALPVLAEARKLASNKPLRYLIVSHHHFDHSGGVRAAAGEGATVIAHEAGRAFFERTLAAPAKVSPDHLAKSGRKATVEGVKDKRVLTDGTRTVEIHQIAGSPHADDFLMVYLPKEKLLIEADAFTPLAPNAPVPTPANPTNVNLADNIAKLGLAVDQILPLHGRVVPLAELHKAIGRAN